jgi:NAD(P)-dependent dehydrogenase (short-subunit alcohol dehydrogenase family)
MNNNQVQSKVVLITGGNSGIGYATALAFAREHANVAITYKGNKLKADQVVAKIKKEGGRGLAIAMDLSDHSSIKNVASVVIKQWGRIDTLVANAINWGADKPQPGRHIEDISLDEWQSMLDTNLIGTIASVQAVLPYMRTQHSGSIILLSSDMTRERMPGVAHYVSVKGALNTILPSMSADFGPDGITVNIVLPGFTLTDKNAQNMSEEVQNIIADQAPTRKLSTPDDIANAITFFAGQKARNITAEMLTVNGGK